MGRKNINAREREKIRPLKWQKLGRGQRINENNTAWDLRPKQAAGQVFDRQDLGQYN